MLTGLVLGQEYARVDNEETENIAGLGIPSRPPTDASKPGKGEAVAPHRTSDSGSSEAGDKVMVGHKLEKVSKSREKRNKLDLGGCRADGELHPNCVSTLPCDRSSHL
jgi:hypothetical protein